MTLKLLFFFLVQETQQPFIKPEESYAWMPSKTTSASTSDLHVATSSLKYTPMSSSGLKTSDNTGVDAHSRLNGDVARERTGVAQERRDSDVHLPSTQSPYITLLQKSRGENYRKFYRNFKEFILQLVHSLGNLIRVLSNKPKMC
jgi:hypothetical protein